MIVVHTTYSIVYSIVFELRFCLSGQSILEYTFGWLKVRVSWGSTGCKEDSYLGEARDKLTR